MHLAAAVDLSALQRQSLAADDRGKKTVVEGVLLRDVLALAEGR